ncbi:MAG TPA: DUF445 domain-containing protein [Nitrospira sp.]|nr:DUF445 domain-containing protein [Nitrospira sp.]
MTGDGPAAALTGYQRARVMATGLLLCMAALFLASLLWEYRYPGLRWVRAFAEAAMVGALADWYAVTALFRRPLGLPIPHTEIIPRNKERIAARLGSLTQRQLLTPGAIGKLIESWRIPDELAALLAEPERRQVLTQEAARLLVRMVEASEDRAMQRCIQRLAAKALRGLQLSPLIGQLIAGFLQSAQRDRLLNDAITFVSEEIQAHRSQLSGLIAEKLPWSRFLSFVRLDETVAEKVVDWLLSLLQGMRDDADDPFRQQLIERLEAGAQWLMHLQRAIQREAAIKEKLLRYEPLLQFMNDSWAGLKQWLLADLSDSKSEIRAYLDAALAGLGETLKADREFLVMVQQGLRDFVIDLAARHRDRIGELVTATVRDWSVVHMVETIEREVGMDLQFIRINGAVVGGLVGLLLYGLAQLIAKS